MARFREIEFWPSTGHRMRQWTDDPDTDAWVKSARRVAELYGERLGEAELTGPVSSLRFITYPSDGDGDAVRLRVNLDRPSDWESGIVWVPPGVAHLPPETRARSVLEVIHGAVAELAPHRGWSSDAVDAVRDNVLARALRFEWASPWKTNRRRSHQARAFFRLEDDGYGRAVLEVRDCRTEDLVARSDEGLAYSTLAGFKRAAKTLRWGEDGAAELVPYSDILGHADGLLRLDPGDGVQPLRPVAADASTAAAPLPLVVAGAWAVPDEASICFVGDGPTNGVPDAYLEEVCRCLRAVERDYLDWWSGADRQQLELWYVLGDGPETPVTRRTSKKLIARIRRNPVTVRRSPDPAGLARDDVRDLLEAVGTKMGLEPHPPLPPS